MWMLQLNLDNRNKKIKESDPYYVFEKIEEIDYGDFATELMKLKENLEKWKIYYDQYEEVIIESGHNHYKDETKYFLCGVRRETELEVKDRLFKNSLKKIQDQKKQEEAKATKKELYLKLKKELEWIE